MYYSCLPYVILNEYTAHLNIFYFHHDLLVPTGNWCLIVFGHKILDRDLLVHTSNWFKIVFIVSKS